MVTSTSSARRRRYGRASWLASLLRRVPVDAQGQATIGAREIYILPTRAGMGYALLLFVTLLGALNYQNNLGLLFTFAMAGVSLVSMHHAWFNLLRLRVRAQPGAPVFAGQHARFVLHVEDGRERERGAGHAVILVQIRRARGPTPAFLAWLPDRAVAALLDLGSDRLPRVSVPE